MHRQNTAPLGSLQGKAAGEYDDVVDLEDEDEDGLDQDVMADLSTALCPKGVARSSTNGSMVDDDDESCIGPAVDEDENSAGCGVAKAKCLQTQRLAN